MQVKLKDQQTSYIGNYLVDAVYYAFQFPAIYISMIAILIVCATFLPASTRQILPDITNRDLSTWAPVILFITYLVRVGVAKLRNQPLIPWAFKKQLITFTALIVLSTLLIILFGEQNYIRRDTAIVLGSVSLIFGIICLLITDAIFSIKSRFLS